MKDWTFLTFGLPHSGKSSFGDKLSNEYAFVHINLGKILRRILKESNLASEKSMIYNAMTNGVMLERDYINILIEAELTDNLHKPVIFDGFPRYESAIVDFYYFINKFNRDIDKVILLNFIIDVEQSIFLQRKRNPETTIISINNRVEQYLKEEYKVFRKMKEEHRHFNLYWENGLENNYKLVTSSINL